MSRLGLAIAALGLTSLMGCAHVDERRADYHERKAERAADHGHFVKAAHEERKANQAEHDAEHDPLP
jgi:hypothetical protein